MLLLQSQRGACPLAVSLVWLTKSAFICCSLKGSAVGHAQLEAIGVLFQQGALPEHIPDRVVAAALLAGSCASAGFRTVGSAAWPTIVTMLESACQVCASLCTALGWCCHPACAAMPCARRFCPHQSSGQL